MQVPSGRADTDNAGGDDVREEEEDKGAHND